VEREFIIDANSAGVAIALLEDKALVELQREKSNKKYSVGDVYLGKVRKIMPGLNAAFVNVGYEKDAFLHYLDLGHNVRSLNKYTRLGISNKIESLSLSDFNLEPAIEKTGKISEVLSVNQQILVQIAKEPIATKGPRVASEISFAGRFLVLVPFSDKISISAKIRSVEERQRLKRLIKSIRPNNFGVIVRTVAENKMVADLDSDLKDLVNKWYLRDLLNVSFNNVYVNDATLAEEIKNYVKTIAPEKAKIVKYYTGAKPIFDQFGINKQIKSSFGKIVTIKSGVYLVIERTEAMYTVDVNSGKRVNRDNNQEVNSLEVNLEQ